MTHQLLHVVDPAVARVGGVARLRSGAEVEHTVVGTTSQVEAIELAGRTVGQVLPLEQWVVQFRLPILAAEIQSHVVLRIRTERVAADAFDPAVDLETGLATRRVDELDRGLGLAGANRATTHDRDRRHAEQCRFHHRAIGRVVGDARIHH